MEELLIEVEEVIVDSFVYTNLVVKVLIGAVVVVKPVDEVVSEL